MTIKKKVKFIISRCYDCPYCSKEGQHCGKYGLSLTWHDMTQECIPEDCLEPDASTTIPSNLVAAGTRDEKSVLIPTEQSR